MDASMIDDSRDPVGTISRTTRHMNFSKETLVQHTSEAASGAIAAVSANAGKFSFFGGLGTFFGALTSTQTLMLLGVIASALGIYFGIRREIRETRKFKAEMALFKKQGVEVET